MPDPASPTTPLSTAIDAYRAAGERGDAEALPAILAPDVVFHSPLTARVRFEGTDDVVALHREIFTVVRDIATTEPHTRGDSGAFSFHAHVRGVELEIMILVRVDDQGQIAELTTFGRPLASVATLFSALPPRVAALRHGPLSGALVALLTRPLAFAVRTADRLAPRFV